MCLDFIDVQQRISVVVFSPFIVHQIFFNHVLYDSCIVVICNIIQKAVASCRISFVFQIPDREYLVRCCYMEIYNEKVSDLLSSEDKLIKIQEDTVSVINKVH